MNNIDFLNKTLETVSISIENLSEAYTNRNELNLELQRNISKTYSQLIKLRHELLKSIRVHHSKAHPIQEILPDVEFDVRGKYSKKGTSNI